MLEDEKDSTKSGLVGDDDEGIGRTLRNDGGTRAEQVSNGDVGGRVGGEESGGGVRRRWH